MLFDKIIKAHKRFVAALITFTLFHFSENVRADVVISWDKNKEPDIAEYVLFYGTASGLYNSGINVGQRTSILLTNLQPSKRYYFAARVWNTANMGSGFSKEISYLEPAAMNLPLWYDFRVNGKLTEATNSAGSSSPYWWVASGGFMTLSNGQGRTILGSLPSGDYWRNLYSRELPTTSDNGYHPQNVFQMYLRKEFGNIAGSIYVQRTANNLTNVNNRQPWNGISLVSRFQEYNDTYYYAGIRNDGDAVIKKKSGGIFKTLAQKKVYAGTYNRTNSPVLIPSNVWIGLRMVVFNSVSGSTKINFYLDQGRTGTWQLITEATDDPATNGPAITTNGLFGIRSDYADLVMDDVRVEAVQTAQSDRTDAATHSVLEPVAPTITVSSDRTITLSGQGGQSFSLQRTKNLLEWEEVASGILDKSGVFPYKDETSSGDYSFYRVLLKDFDVTL